MQVTPSPEDLCIVFSHVHLHQGQLLMFGALLRSGEWMAFDHHAGTAIELQVSISASTDPFSGYKTMAHGPIELDDYNFGAADQLRIWVESQPEEDS